MNETKELYLKEEYFKLQDQYEDYDKRALQIKGWTCAGSIAGFSFSADQDACSPTMILISIICINMCFWYLETSWKMFQYSISDRIRIIEAYFRNDKDILIKEPEPLQIYHWWFRSYVKDEAIYSWETKRPRSKLTRMLDAGTQAFVQLPYTIIIGLSFLMLVIKS